MTEHERLEEQLRVLRGLVGRVATIRALFAPIALVGGLCSLAVAIWMLRRTGMIGGGLEEPMTAREFVAPWLVVSLATLATATVVTWREMRKAPAASHSLGLQLARRSVLPGMLIGASVAYVAWRNPSDLDAPVIVALTWISCYGVALLALINFAPRALTVLGWSFIITAVVWLLILSAPTLPDFDLLHEQTGANLLMGLTFGVYHLICALAIWVRPLPNE